MQKDEGENRSEGEATYGERREKREKKKWRKGKCRASSHSSVITQRLASSLKSHGLYKIACFLFKTKQFPNLWDSRKIAWKI